MSRDASHIRAQKKARERDGYVCQICGSKNHTEAHHTMDVQYGGAADADQMVTLCHNCHQKAHSGLLDLFVFR